MKKVVYGLVGLVVLLVAAALIVPSLIDWNAYKSEITAEVNKATGRTLVIDGNLDLDVLPAPRLTAFRARLSNLPGAAAPNMVSLRALYVRVKFAPLLQGKIEVASVELLEPTIELERLADGRANWDFASSASNGSASNGPASNGSAAAPTSRTAPAAPGTAQDTSSGNEGSDSFRLDNLKITDGTIVYRDTVAGTVERIEKLSADVTADSLSGPFSVRGGLTARGLPLTVTANLGRLTENGSVPLSVDAGVADTDTRASLRGTLTDTTTGPRLSAKLAIKGKSFQTLMGTVTGGASPAALAQPFSLDASLTADDAAVSLDDLALELGGAKASGKISVALANTISAKVSLNAQRIDANPFLAMEKSGKEATTSSRKAASTPGEPAGAPADTAPNSAPGATASAAAAPVIPDDIDASISIGVEEVIYRDGRVRDLRFVTTLKDGALSLDALSARFPGNGEVSATGRASSPGGELAYDGKVTMRSANLRRLLDWLDADAPDIPADRLRRLSAIADISGNLSQLQLGNIQMQFDASRVSGGVTFALRERPAFGASFNVDQFNVDAYLPRPSVRAGSAPPAAPASPQPAGGDAPAARSQTAAGPMASLAVLKDFDANLVLRVGSLNYRNRAIQGVRFDGTLVEGAMTIRDASVRSLAGTSARIKGNLSGFDGLPAFKGTVAAASNNLSGLFRVLDIDSPVPPRKLGRMRLTASTNVSAEGLGINGKLELAEMRATVTGSVTGFPGAPNFDIRMTGAHPEVARLAALFGDGKPGPKAGRISLDLTAKGGADAVGVQAGARFAGGSFRLSGTLAQPLDAPRYDVNLDLRHNDLTRFVRVFDPGFSPSKRRLGGLALTAGLKGDADNLAIEALKGSIGPTPVSGSGSYKSTDLRPVLDLTLSSGVIPLSDFLEAPRGGASSRAAAPAGRPGRPGSGASGAAPPSQPASRGPVPAPSKLSDRWSSEPIDTDVFGLVDARIDLGADALLYKTFRIDKPKIVAVMKDKVLTVERVAGTMFDGGFEMTGAIDARSVPAAKTSIRVDNANVGKALFQTGAFDIATGVLTFGLDLNARGASQAAMIKALTGNGRIRVADGVVQGFDLRKVSDGLNRLDNVAGLLGLVGGAMGGGTTKFSSLDGTFDVKNGVMRTSDLRIAAEAGAGSARGFADLPGWNMDMLAEFRLTEHKSAPPFRVRATGAPDNPRRFFDFQDLQAWVLQRGVGGVLQQLIPGLRRGNTPKSGSQGQPAPQGQQLPQNQQNQQNQQQPREINPADVLKDLLKGLGR